MKAYKKWLIAIGSIIVIALHTIPFYILLTSSFKAADDLSSKWAFPGYVYLDNFLNAWNEANLGRAFINNILITGIAVVLVVAIGSLAAYPLARHQTKWNKFMYMLFISVLIVPPLAILVPLYRFYVDIHALNTYWGIILIHVTFHLPITIFLFTGFIGTIPKDLDEAGMIDGSSRVGLFFRLIMPLLKPVTATVIILAGVAIWNDYQFSVFFLEKTEVRTITVSLAKFFGQYNSNIGWVAAGSLMGALPITLVYLALQKQFIHGLSSGAVKG